MKLNQNSSFSRMPSVSIKRSVISRPFNHKTTFNAADIVPFYCQPVLPGTSVALKSACKIRMTTSIHATMDKAYVDTYWFFVPNRLVWSKWEQFLAGSAVSGSSNNGKGGNLGDWNVSAAGDLVMPYMRRSTASGSLPGLPFSSVTVGSIYNYLGVPLPPSGSGNFVIDNVLRFRCYHLIYSEWFRDENLISSVGAYADFDSNAPTDFSLKKAAKFHDYFTSALIKPQKGNTVTIPIGNTAPVGFFDKENGFWDKVFKPSLDDTAHSGYDTVKSVEDFYKNNSQYLGLKHNIFNDPHSSTFGSAIDYNKMGSDNPSFSIVADLSQATATTINELRLLFQTQKFLEKNAMYGTRYTEMLKAHFGCTVPDYRLQRPEYLGGSRQLVDMRQVTQTSQTYIDNPSKNTVDNSSLLGEVAGQSVTVGRSGGFVKSFSEHGYLMGLVVVRAVHTYQYGIEKDLTKKTRLEHYWAVFANIGYQPIYNREIFAQGTSADDEIFGYQEAWSEYRYTPNRISGYFSSRATGTLDSWHYADKFDSLPTLTSTFIEETRNNIDRTLAIQSSTMHQFIGDFEVSSKWTVPMPVNSIPGLIDHF